MLLLSRPQAGNRRGEKPVAKWNDLVSTVKDKPCLEGGACRVSQASQAAEIFRPCGRRGFNLHADDFALSLLEDKIDFHLVFVAIVADAGAVFQQRACLAQLSIDETLKERTDQRTIARKRIFVDVAQRGQ